MNPVAHSCGGKDMANCALRGRVRAPYAPHVFASSVSADAVHVATPCSKPTAFRENPSNQIVVSNPDRHPAGISVRVWKFALEPGRSSDAPDLLDFALVCDGNGLRREKGGAGGCARGNKRKVLRSLAQAQDDSWGRGLASATGDVSIQKPPGAWDYRAVGNQRKLSTARATILMIVSADEEDATVEMDMYFTGLSPDARIRAAAFLGIPDRVMATREVARAKLRMLDFMAILLLALAAGC
jgi:hypothetical protein